MKFLKRLVIMSGEKTKGTLNIELNSYGVFVRFLGYGADFGGYDLVLRIDERFFYHQIKSTQDSFSLTLKGEIADINVVHAAVFFNQKLIMYGTNDPHRLSFLQISHFIQHIKQEKNVGVSSYNAVSCEKSGGIFTRAAYMDKKDIGNDDGKARDNTLSKDELKNEIFLDKRGEKPIKDNSYNKNESGIKTAGGLSAYADEQIAEENYYPDFLSFDSTGLGDTVLPKDLNDLGDTVLPKDLNNLGDTVLTNNLNNLDKTDINIFDKSLHSAAKKIRPYKYLFTQDFKPKMVIKSKTADTKNDTLVIAENNAPTGIKNNTSINSKNNAAMQEPTDIQIKQNAATRQIKNIDDIFNQARLSQGLASKNTDALFNKIKIKETKNTDMKDALNLLSKMQDTDAADLKIMHVAATTTKIDTENAKSEDDYLSPANMQQLFIMTNLAAKPTLSNNQGISSNASQKTGKGNIVTNTALKSDENTLDSQKTGKEDFLPHNKSFDPVKTNTKNNLHPFKDTQNKTNADEDQRIAAVKSTAFIPSRQSTFFEKNSEEIEKLFMGEREKQLEELLPYSRWAKINYGEKDKYYVIGIIGKEYLCYGVPSIYSPVPPDELKGYCWWMPVNPLEPKQKGYWIMYQSLTSGKTILPAVE